MSAPLLSVRDLSVTFDVPRKGAMPWTPPQKLRAVQDISFDLKAGETLGVVGESGSGKSTLARAVIGTIPASSGRVVWQGTELTGLSVAARRKHRAEVQMVFQDPLAALNPRMTVGEIIAEPLRTHRDVTRDEARRASQEMMERVGLLPNLVNRYPHEFSGGQCQRIGIARALILEPRLLICDEPVSALDASVQAQVVNLLRRLGREMGLAMIFIAHDLSVVRHVSDRIMVMYLGRKMEEGAAREVVGAPLHPYAKALISAIPRPDPTRKRARIALEGELPSPLAPPSGCVFHTRCPVARPDCSAGAPALAEPAPGRMVACPYHSEPVRAAVNS
ncbi:ABC transporter ATP-binding protein [Jannaschia aquimarina]|uniref:OppF_1 protein n=1 Tax=Jannaschia aquimarina TaxID=935700 RepID=A0A0D1EHK6_9RHOB|nr:oligopeptide/dipeptide ABC transporter ATP-binding protein [Jannaschia aquimarina]KIT16316.1 Oligopeptide transport ATP-binding protein OppF [Jannaschia aquimarina]SNT26314.1 oligopeptide transport system ATP-binding protein [Jannaschia aquimarina]